MQTINDYAVKILKSTEKEIKQTDLLKIISNKTGYSIESVRGSMLGIGKGRLQTLNYFKNNWFYVRNPTRFIRKEFSKNNEIYKINYDTEEKQRYRTRIIAELAKLNINNPRILTLASNTGFCVRDFRKNFNNCEIINIERDFDILESFKKLDFKNIKNIHSELSDFIINNKLKFDLMNLDLMGYFSHSKVPMFEKINTKKPKIVAINMQYSKNPRNHGTYVDFLIDKYKKNNDIIKSALEDIFNNYNIVDEIIYNRDATKKCRKMRTFIFKLKNLI